MATAGSTYAADFATASMAYDAALETAPNGGAAHAPTPLGYGNYGTVPYSYPVKPVDTSANIVPGMHPQCGAE